MRIALLGKRKYGFVTGACSRTLYPDALHEQWETCNAIVLSWLMSTVSEKLLSGIVYATTAYTVWEDLKERFDKVNRMRIHQLHREIHTLSQGTDSVSTYFTKLKNLWGEFDALVPSPSCACPKSKEYADHMYQMRLIQFLSGLNESYDQARRQILLKGVTPSINQAYAMIIEDEIQHSACVAAACEKPDATALAMQVNRGHVFNTGNQNYKGRKCEYCHFTGHTKENCYKLIGYPADWKQRRKSGYNNSNSRGQSVHDSGGQNNQGFGNFGGNSPNFGGNRGNTGQLSANVTAGSRDQVDHTNTNSQEVNNAFMAKAHGFTDGEYRQIMDMLHKDNKEVKQANMTADRKLLTTSRCLDKSQGEIVNLPTGDKAEISHIGEACMFNSETVKGVLVVPDFKFNLLSVSKITKELSCFVSFYPDFCVFQDLCSGRVKGIGREEGSLYFFKGACGETKHSGVQKHPRIAAGVSQQDCGLWHRRLGHPSSHTLKCLDLLHNNKDA
ncbi:hypothetical protein KY289_006602 [Solanum tuberosum]|nr:hypothetical protein KY289_006602 [Solanum tuberosum]